MVGQVTAPRSPSRSGSAFPWPWPTCLVTSGIAWYWAPLSALLIFAGSIELLSVSLITSGVPPVSVALTSLVVNMRHMFYGLSFPLRRLRTTPQKVYGVFALTDETYGITSAGEGSRLSGPQITALQLVSHAWWVGGAALGALVGQVVPPGLRGLEFALTAMFVTLAVDATRARRDSGLLLLALGSAVVGLAVDRLLVDGSFLFVGLVAYLVAVIARHLRSRSDDDEQVQA